MSNFLFGNIKTDKQNYEERGATRDPTGISRHIQMPLSAHREMHNEESRGLA